jgi:hypothetical protein
MPIISRFLFIFSCATTFEDLQGQEWRRPATAYMHWVFAILDLPMLFRTRGNAKGMAARISEHTTQPQRRRVVRITEESLVISVCVP